ncbi:MAG TPA: IPT/TIG domain-containing protein [Bacteroides reticulotermitis]|nr:IPT/TIG domain-containing protein [Bacteroides reticulotermitis]
MKKSNYWKSEHGYLYSVVLVLIIFCFAGCKDNDEAENVFDPGKPVLITDFLPKKGGFGSNLILYGDNFGNNPSNIKVTIG